MFATFQCVVCAVCSKAVSLKKSRFNSIGFDDSALRLLCWVRYSRSLFLSMCALFALGLGAFASANELFSIKVNQVGYLPTSSKVAIVPASGNAKARSFEVVDVFTHKVVYSGELGKPSTWPFSKETVRQADFSSLNQPGRYYLASNGVVSAPFEIGDTVFNSVHAAALKSFYFKRSGMTIEPQYGWGFARAAGHLDTKVKVHASAASDQRPKGSIISAPKGWYDAGDYGKYVVNSGISTYTLLSAYDQFSQVYKDLPLGIVESNNQVPDLLDEIKWNLDWLETMQDLDGGVYHKLTALRFSSMDVLPKDEKSQRWVIGKSVTAALNFSAVMSFASQVFSDFENEFPGASQRYLERAKRAFKWANENPSALYQQPGDVQTGEYGDDDARDEFSWAAAELFLATGNDIYLAVFRMVALSEEGKKADLDLSWSNVTVLPYVSLYTRGQKLLSEEDFKFIESQLLDLGNAHLEHHQASAYNVSMTEGDFNWGSNSAALNNGFVLFQAYLITGDHKFKSAAFATLDYVLGTNPTGYSYVTGYGTKTPMKIHDRPSEADNAINPIPGFLVGGPHTGRQDKCKYSGKLPATNYADSVCSYSTNEIAINWNAPLVYMLGAAIASK